METRKRRYIHWIMPFISMGFVFGIFEIVCRINSFTPIDPGIPVCQTCKDCSYLFALNPEHRETGPQGLRDKKYEIPKPPGKIRIVVMGDSIVYGIRVKRTDVLTERLETLLDHRSPDRYEVINAGVCGYSPYNEFYFYRDKIVYFEPDIVVLGLCLNDVVDPYLHWNQRYAHLTQLPEAAFPNPAYHQQVLKRKTRQIARKRPLLKENKKRTVSYFWDFLKNRKMRSSKPLKRRWCLTSEDTLSINVWLEDSPEWNWFKNMYRLIRDLVENSGAVFSVVVFPLKFQLENENLQKPQSRIVSFLKSENIPVLDMLPIFISDQKKIRIIRQELFGDKWHLTAKGHYLTARALEEFLFEAFPLVMTGEGKIDSSGFKK